MKQTINRYRISVLPPFLCCAWISTSQLTLFSGCMTFDLVTMALNAPVQPCAPCAAISVQRYRWTCGGTHHFSTPLGYDMCDCAVLQPGAGQQPAGGPGHEEAEPTCKYHPASRAHSVSTAGCWSSRDCLVFSFMRCGDVSVTKSLGRCL